MIRLCGMDRLPYDNGCAGWMVIIDSFGGSCMMVRVCNGLYMSGHTKLKEENKTNENIIFTL
jgi:hypothetical protein